MRELVVRESDFAGANELHAFLQQELGFPSHYGRNLSALNDCLGDICTPTRIVVGGPPNRAGDWQEGFRRVFARQALENPYLDVTLSEGHFSR